jgi:hypothetical protein
MMAPDPISMAYFINPSDQSVCLYISLLSFIGKGSIKCIPTFIARQRLVNKFPRQLIDTTIEELLDA